MNSSSRIKSSSIKLGESFVLGEGTASKNSSINLMSDEEFVARQEQEQKFLERVQNMLTDAEFKAKTAISNAEQKAIEIMQSAREQGYARGQEDGFAQGMNDAMTAFNTETAGALRFLDAISNASYDIKKQILLSLESEVLELVVLIAEKIAKSHIELDKNALLPIITTALSELKEKEEVKILINPEHADSFSQFTEEIKAVICDIGHIKFIPDKTVAVHGVIVESKQKRIDATLEVQVEELVKNFMKEAARNSKVKEIPAEIDEKIEVKAAKKVSKKTKSEISE